MTFIVLFAVVAVVLVVPVMIGARMVGAKNTGFGSAFLAVIILAFFSSAIDALVVDDVLAVLAAVIFGTFVLAWILGTTFFRALAVSVIATIIQAVAIIALAATVGIGSA